MNIPGLARETAPKVRKRDSTGRYRRIIAAVAAALVGKGSSLIVNLVSIPVLVRYLGAEQFGLWTTISTMAGMLIILDVGIASTVTNLISESYARDDRRAARHYFATAFWISLGIVSFFGLLLWTFWGHINWAFLFRLQTPELASAVSVSMATAVGIFLLGIPIGLSARVFAGYQELHTANLFTAACSLLSLVALLLLVHCGFALPWLVAASISAPVAANLVGLGWICFRKRWVSLSPRLLRWSLASRIFRSGGQFFLIQMASLVIFNSDNIIISHYLGASQVTPYSIIWRLVGYAILIQTMVNPALWPAYAEANARGDLPWIRRAYNRVRKGTFLALALSWAVLIPFGRPIIRLWAGPVAVPSQILVILMCVWMVLIAVTRNQSTLIGASGRMRNQSIASFVSAIVNLWLSIVWVKDLGTVGVLLATIVTYVAFILTVQGWEVRSILHPPSSQEATTA